MAASNAHELVRESFSKLKTMDEEFTLSFYNRLFKNAPEARALFPDDITPQAKKLGSTLFIAVNSLENIDLLVPILHDLGAKHREFGAQPEHYPLVVDTLIETMASYLGEIWSSEHEEAWRAIMEIISETMLAGAEKGQTPEPKISNG